MTADATGRGTRSANRARGRGRGVALGLVPVLAFGCWWLTSRSSAIAFEVTATGALDAEAVPIATQRVEVGAGTDPAVPERREVEPEPATTGAELFGHISAPSIVWGPGAPPLTLALVKIDQFATLYAQITIRSPEFTVPGVGPGTYLVRVEGERIRTSETALGVPQDVARVQHDIVLGARWDLKVEMVTPQDRPLLAVLAETSTKGCQIDLRVVMTGSPLVPSLPGGTGADPELGFVSWEHGRQGLPGRPTRTASPIDPDDHAAHLIDIPSEDPAYVSVVLGNAVLASTSVVPGQSEVRFVIAQEAVVAALCKVSLRVVERASFQPLANLLVMTRSGVLEGRLARTDAEGRLCSICMPGVVFLAVESGGSQLPMRVEVAPGFQVDLGDLAIEAPVRVHFDFEAVPSGAEIDLRVRSLERLSTTDGEPTWNRLPIGTKARSGPAMLHPGHYLLFAKAGDRTACREFDAVAASTGSVVVTMQSAALVHVIPPRIDRSVRLEFIAARGIGLWSVANTLGVPFDVELVPGGYVVEVHRPDGVVERRPLTLASGTTELDLR